MIQKNKKAAKLVSRFFQANSRDLLPLGIAFALAFVLRTIYLFELRDSIFFGNYVLDSRVLDVWAASIAGGDVLGEGAFFRAPLYPYLVGFLYAIFGQSPMAVIPWQFFMGIVTTLLVYFYARYVFNRQVAFVSAVIASCWPTLIYFEGELMLTSLTVFLSMCSITALHLALDSGQRKSYLVAGLILGLAAITKPTVIPLVLILPLYHLLKGGSNKYHRIVRYGMIYVAGMLIVILPVTARNLAVAGEPVLISSQGGANFYIGNSKYADGITVKMPLSGAVFEGGKFDDNVHSQSVSLAQQALGQELNESRVSSYWYKQALEEMVNDPLRTLALFAKKAYYFWHGQEIFNNKSLYYAGEYSKLMEISLWKTGVLNFPSGLLFPLMFVGIVFAVRHRAKFAVPISYIIIYFAVVILFFVCARFRQPVVPMAIIFASYGLVEFREALRNRKGGLILPAGVFVVLVIALNTGGDIESTENKSQYLNIVGTAHLQQGDLRSAAAYLQESLEVAPGNRSAIGSLAQTYVQAGRTADAEQTLKQGIQLHPDAPSLYYNLGVIYTNSGRLEGAKACFHRTIELDSLWPAPYLGLRAIYEHEGDQDSAAVMQGIIERHR